MHGRMALDERANQVVAYAERLRENEAAQSHHDRAQRRPPHPVQLQLGEEILDAVDGLGDQRGQQSGEYAGQHTSQQDGRTIRKRMRHRGKERSGAEHVPARHRGRGTGQGHRDQAARLPFKQENFHRQQHRGNRRIESGGHAARSSGYEQRFPLGAGEVEELRDERAHGAAGHDDRPLGAERPAGADGDGRGERFEHRQARGHATAVHQDGFDGFGNAVAADLLRAVAGHQAHDQPAGNGHQHHQRAQVMLRRRYHREIPARVEKQVGEEANQAQQDHGAQRAEESDGDGGKRNGDDAKRGGVIAQFPGLLLPVHAGEEAEAAGAGRAHALGEARFGRFHGCLRGAAARGRWRDGRRLPAMTRCKAWTSSGPAVRNSAR